MTESASSSERTTFDIVSEKMEQFIEESNQRRIILDRQLDQFGIQQTEFYRNMNSKLDMLEQKLHQMIEKEKSKREQFCLAAQADLNAIESIQDEMEKKLNILKKS